MKTRRRRQKCLAILVLLALLSSLLAPWAGVAQAEDWVPYCVDCRKKIEYMSDRSLRLDGAGQPHLAYGSDYLYYAWHDGSTWHHETVDPTPGTGAYAALVLDNSGNPHISYASFQEGIKYAFRAGGVWHSQVVDSREGSHTSLALDGQGYAHISYVVGLESLGYAYQDAAGWHLETVYTERADYNTSLALDAAGRPHIAFIDWNNIHVMYAHKEGGTWYVEQAAWLGAHGVSLALDASGVPYIAYNDGWALTVAHRDLSGWQAETALMPRCGYNTSLVIDGDGYPHFSCEYDDGITEHYLKYAYQDAAGWHTATVASEGHLGAYNSLALSADGTPHISYLNSTNNSLDYAHEGPSGWQIETVDYTGATNVGELALDGQGNPHISYTVDWGVDEGHAKHAFKDEGGWHTELVGSIEENLVGWLSLAVDGQGFAHISHYDVESPEWAPAIYNLRHTYQDVTGWHTEILTTYTTYTGSGVGGTSLALGTQDRAHIVYCQARTLSHAYQDNAGWHFETIDSNIRDCIGTTLALDTGDYPHIVYNSGYPDYDVRYAYRDSSGWHIETVVAAGGEFSRPVLALTSQGQPRVAYSSESGLEFAYRDASGWHAQTAVPSDQFITGKSMKLDGDDRAHIVYFAGLTYSSLIYAYQDGVTWRVETMAAEVSFWGSTLFMDLDANGCPHVSYWDGRTYDLQYLTCLVQDHVLYLPLVTKLKRFRPQ